MDQEKWTEIDRYFSDLFAPEDLTLLDALVESAAAGLPPHNVTPSQGKLLMLLARAIGARNILEIGTLGGYSTIWLARGLPADGKLVTLDALPRHAEVARRNIARAGLTDVVELRVGRALDTLPQLAAEGRGPFDLVFIDADKPNNADYFTWALRMSRPGTLIIADNVVRAGAVVDRTSADASVQGIRRFNERVAACASVAATAIQTVGSKGHDGFALVFVIQPAG